MSYDISVHGPGGSQGEEADPLGARADVVIAIEAAFPGVRWVDQNWGDFGNGKGSAEFNLNEEDPLSSFAVHLRGDFVELIEGVYELAKSKGWQVFDWQDDGADEDEFEI